MPVRPVNPPPTDFAEWSDEARAARLARFLADAPVPGELWVFAAGSLIWDPRFDPAETRVGRLDGWRRAFSFWTVRARGSPERPGLGLALEPGGACESVVLRIGEAAREGVLAALWRREMSAGVYVPTWLPVATDAGPIHAIGFAANPEHRNYAGILDHESAAAIIAAGVGSRGPYYEYLALLVEALAGHGIVDAEVSALHAAVQARLGQGT